MFKRCVAVLCALCVAGCAGGAAASARGGLSAWIAYWETEGVLDEVHALNGSLEAIVFFAAFFGEDNTLFVPASLMSVEEDVRLLLRDDMPVSYLSFVNDRVTDAGQSYLKSTELLWALFETTESTQAHVDDLIAMTRDYGFDGIEIDYEAIGSDMALWERFVSFLALLIERAQASGFRLRVLLEPSAPLEMIQFPAGPTYVMMCYNLHGEHSGPGPKADDALLRRLAGRMEVLPGERGFALAGGGFHWVEGERARPVTQNVAEALAAENGANAVRDEASGSLSFRYTDENGRGNTVWYADAETLARWRDVVAEFGAHGVSLWKLGGNHGLDLLMDTKEE